MRELGIEGISRRRKKVFTTIADPDAVRAPDLVKRNFTADRPDALWVTDLTYVPTRSGMAHVCFIVDAFSRRIVGWRVASNMRTDMVLDALEMARRSRGNRRLVGLVAHADAGSQFTSVRFTERLDEIGARPFLSERSPTRSTTRWPRRPTGSTRPSASTAPTRQGPGRASRSSSSPPSPGCTGSTRTASTATAETSRPPSTRQRSTLPNRPTPPGLESNRPSLHQTQGGSTGSTRPSASTKPTPRARETTSSLSSPRWPGSTRSKRSASAAPAATDPRRARSSLLRCPAARLHRGWRP